MRANHFLIGITSSWCWRKKNQNCGWYASPFLYPFQQWTERKDCFPSCWFLAKTDEVGFGSPWAGRSRKLHTVTGDRVHSAIPLGYRTDVPCAPHPTGFHPEQAMLGLGHPGQVGPQIHTLGLGIASASLSLSGVERPSLPLSIPPIFGANTGDKPPCTEPVYA
jgi:hypothetical protein